MKSFFLSVMIFFLSLSSFLSAGTVRLFNDSSYKLRAVIRGADGSYIGETVLVSQSSNIWTDSQQHYGHYDEATPNEKGATRSQTPYSVIWYCMDGSDYAFCDNVGTGSMVQAQQCQGRRSCKPSTNKKAPGTYRSDKSDKEYIPPEEEEEPQ